MVHEAKKQLSENRAVLNTPLSMEWGRRVERRSPNLVQRILGLFRGVRHGADLSRFELPPQFNMPRSQLQCYGGILCTTRDMLTQCERGETSLERITAVAAWSISMVRPFFFGAAPFNPVLGETHHISRGSLNVLLEQVSHHPPVSALHATDSQANVELIWTENPVAKFNGTSVEIAIKGCRRLNLIRHGESYDFNSPAMMINLLPIPGTDWAGVVRIRCKESGLEAELRYHRSHFGLGLLCGNSRAVKGKIFRSGNKEVIREIFGRWDEDIKVKDVASGKVSLLYDGKPIVSKLEASIPSDSMVLRETESAVVWAEVSEAMMNDNWDLAREAKQKVEEEQRRLREERAKGGKVWEPKFFRLTQKKDSGWECNPKAAEVPPAPLVVSPQI